MARSVEQLRTGDGDTLPVIGHRGAAGLTVAVTANVHGDEATGVAAVQLLDERLRELRVRGRVWLYPSLNPSGLSARTRVLPAGHDLNRLFPGRRDGGVSERHAHAVWSDLQARGVGLVVDLHADSARSVPYAIVDRALATGAGAGLAPTLEAHAHATGLTVLREYPVDDYVRYGLDRSLAGALVNRAGLVALTIEAGPRRWIDREAVHATVGAVLGVLTHAGVVDAPQPAHPSRQAAHSWRRAPAPRVQHAGLFREQVAPGQTFRSGDELGAVLDLQGRVRERVRAEADGVVVSWAESCWLASGAAPGTLGVVE